MNKGLQLYSDFHQGEFGDNSDMAFMAGWAACHARFEEILKRFPLQCTMITNRLPLHPSQPDNVLEQ